MKQFKIYIVLLASLFAMVSCLDDEKVENQEYGLLKKHLETKKIIEIPADASHSLSKAYLAEGMQKVTLGEVRLAAKDPAAEDIIVKLKKGSDSEVIAMLRTYKSNIYTENVPNSDIHLFSPSDIKLPESIVIPAGKQSAPLTIEINTDLLKEYSQFFAINVESVSNQGYIISGNYNNLLVEVKEKSKYEGKYEYKVETNLSGNSGDVYLSTVTPNKVKMDKLANNYGYEVFYTIDASTNKVTVECPKLGKATITTGEYNPSTKSFHVVWSLRDGQYTFDETFKMK